MYEGCIAFASQYISTYVDDFFTSNSKITCSSNLSQISNFCLV